MTRSQQRLADNWLKWRADLIPIATLRYQRRRQYRAPRIFGCFNQGVCCCGVQQSYKSWRIHIGASCGCEDKGGAWLSYVPTQLITFVGNRTSEILDTFPRKAWRHVDSKSNPADCASRGLMAADLIDFHLFWNEPLWLRDQDQYMVRFND